MGPTTNEKGYHELEEMRSVIPSNTVVVVHSRLGYEVQYVTPFDIASRHPQTFGDHTYTCSSYIRNLPPKLPPGSMVLFHGSVFTLVELPRPKLAG